VVAAHVAPTTGDDPITRVDLLLDLDVLSERVSVLGDRALLLVGLSLRRLSNLDEGKQCARSHCSRLRRVQPPLRVLVLVPLSLVR
jgi:hypothetical protein